MGKRLSRQTEPHRRDKGLDEPFGPHPNRNHSHHHCPQRGRHRDHQGQERGWALHRRELFLNWKTVHSFQRLETDHSPPHRIQEREVKQTKDRAAGVEMSEPPSLEYCGGKECQ